MEATARERDMVYTFHDVYNYIFLLFTEVSQSEANSIRLMDVNFLFLRN